jgi:DNA polymerase I
MEKKKLIIIDANAVVHRAFHALPPLSTKKGELVNAIYGFLLVFFKAIKEFEPDYIVAAFDYPAPTFRHKKYRLYKAKREKAPQELYDQIPRIKEVLQAFNVKVLEKQGFEADDIIGTVAKQAEKRQISPAIETIILTGDLDALQLVDKNTKVYALRKGVKDTILYDENKVKEKMSGLAPSQVVDYKALRGDPSDNIPGVTGIGEKTAVDLLLKFKSLDNIYQELRNNTAEINERVKEKLKNQKDQAMVSRMLAEINKDVPLDFNLEDSLWARYNQEKAAKILEEYEFKTLLNKLPKIKNNLSLW